MIDPAEFPVVSFFDRDIARFYDDDGSRSGIEKSVPIILACRSEVCSFCYGPLSPAVSAEGLPLDSSYLHRSVERDTRVNSRHGWKRTMP